VIGERGGEKGAKDSEVVQCTNNVLRGNGEEAPAVSRLCNDYVCTRVFVRYICFLCF